MGRCGTLIKIFGAPILGLPTFYEIVYKLGAFLYSIVAWAIEIIYQLFAALATARLFNEEIIKTFAERIYTILGIVMVFVVLINLFKMMADPDNLVKSGKNTGKALLTNIVVTVGLLVSINFIFNFAYEAQSAILADNVIGRLFFGQVEDDGTVSEVSDPNLHTTMKNGGRAMATSLLQAFFYRKGLENAGVLGEGGFENNAEIKLVQDEYDYNDRDASLTPVPMNVFFEMIRNDTVGADGIAPGQGFELLSRVECETIKNNITFAWLLAFFAGLVVIYILFVYSIDLGIRVIKLAFYQLIAPIPISMRMLPGQEKSFSNWVTATVTAFVEVFVRLAVVYFAVFVIQLVTKLNLAELWVGQEKPQALIAVFAQALIMIGVVLFMKIAPKLINDVLGIKGEGYDLGFGLKKVKKNLSDGVEPFRRAGNTAYGMGSGAFNNYKQRKPGTSGFGAALSGAFRNARTGYNYTGSIRDTLRGGGLNNDVDAANTAANTDRDLRNDRKDIYGTTTIGQMMRDKKEQLIKEFESQKAARAEKREEILKDKEAYWKKIYAPKSGEEIAAQAQAAADLTKLTGEIAAAIQGSAEINKANLEAETLEARANALTVTNADLINNAKAAQSRRDTLTNDKATVENGIASAISRNASGVINAREEYEKTKKAYESRYGAVSSEESNADINNLKTTKANLESKLADAEKSLNLKDSDELKAQIQQINAQIGLVEAKNNVSTAQASIDTSQLPTIISNVEKQVSVSNQIISNLEAKKDSLVSANASQADIDDIVAQIQEEKGKNASYSADLEVLQKVKASGISFNGLNDLKSKFADAIDIQISKEEAVIKSADAIQQEIISAESEARVARVTAAAAKTKVIDKNREEYERNIEKAKAVIANTPELVARLQEEFGITDIGSLSIDDMLEPQTIKNSDGSIRKIVSITDSIADWSKKIEKERRDYDRGTTGEKKKEEPKKEEKKGDK